MKSYLITDSAYYGSDHSSLIYKIKEVSLNYKIDFICYRDKENPLYEKIAPFFMRTCRELKIENIFLHTHVELAKELNATGVHLSSKQFNEIKKAKALDLKVIISTHSLDEAVEAQKDGADFITYSPIFETPNKGNPKGLEDLKEIVDKMQIKIFALGGIVTQSQVEQLSQSGVYGFASIRYFLD
jgi:thiamine-phosphate pyrophosphorylase